MPRVAAEVELAGLHRVEPVRGEFAERQPQGVIEPLVHRPVERLRSQDCGLRTRNVGQRPDGFEPHLRVIVGDSRGKQFGCVRQPVRPRRHDATSGGPGAVILRGQHRFEQLRIDLIERLANPQGFEGVVFDLRVRRVQPRPATCPTPAALPSRRAPSAPASPAAGSSPRGPSGAPAAPAPSRPTSFGFGTSGRPLAVIRQMRPCVLSRRGSRKSTSPCWMIGLYQSAM